MPHCVECNSCSHFWAYSLNSTVGNQHSRSPLQLFTDDLGRNWQPGLLVMKATAILSWAGLFLWSFKPSPFIVLYLLFLPYIPPVASMSYFSLRSARGPEFCDCAPVPGSQYVCEFASYSDGSFTAMLDSDVRLTMVIDIASLKTIVLVPGSSKAVLLRSGYACIALC